jgi:hypothetical protein
MASHENRSSGPSNSDAAEFHLHQNVEAFCPQKTTVPIFSHHPQRLPLRSNPSIQMSGLLSRGIWRKVKSTSTARDKSTLLSNKHNTQANPLFRRFRCEPSGRFWGLHVDRFPWTIGSCPLQDNSIELSGTIVVYRYDVKGADQ